MYKFATKTARQQNICGGNGNYNYDIDQDTMMMDEFKSLLRLAFTSKQATCTCMSACSQSQLYYSL